MAQDGPRSLAGPSPLLMPWLTRALGTLRKQAPRAYGWCRPRWRCAPRAATLQATPGLGVAAAPRRRWLQERAWGWKRAQHVPKEDAPHRRARWARIRSHHDQWQAQAVMGCAAALDLPRLPQGGAAWMPQGRQDESRTPGTHAPHARAGARPLATGKRRYGLGRRPTTGGFRALLTRLATASPAPAVPRIDVVVDHDWMQQAKAVTPWGASHARCALRWFPPDWPRANPSERVCGDGHAKCPRNHKRQRLRGLVQAVERPMPENGPWQYQRSRLSEAPEVTAAVEHLAAENQSRIAA
jgi:hypothetical protein